MPNIKSAKKRVRTIAKKTLKNQMCISEMKTAIRKFDTALEGGDKKLILETYTEAVRLVDKAAAKGNLKKNTAARRKSLLTRKLTGKSVQAPAAKTAAKKPAAKPAAKPAEAPAEKAKEAPEKTAEEKPAAKTAAKKPAAKTAAKKPAAKTAAKKPAAKKPAAKAEKE